MKDLTNLKTYIIDSENAHEIDDAVSIEFLEGNRSKLWIHISNPCKFFLLDSDIDRDARRKNSSLYLINEYVPMLPTNIIERANLYQNKVTNTISASIIFNEDGSINKFEITEAKIKPKYQLTYDDVNEILELELKEEIDIVEIYKLLLKSKNYREKKGAIFIENPSCKIIFNRGKISINKVEKSMGHILVSEAMILMGYVSSIFLFDNNLSAAYRTHKLNCNPNEILSKYVDSEIKYILLKQYLGKSFISSKPSFHESLGLKMYVQCTSPLRRYLDLIIQRQIFNKLNNLPQIDNNIMIRFIDLTRSKQLEINNIYKNDKTKYLVLFFKNENKPFYKIYFVKWINYKRNVALVFFPEYSLEVLVTLYVSIEIYSNKIYKVKYNKNLNDNLEFIY